MGGVEGDSRWEETPALDQEGEQGGSRQRVKTPSHKAKHRGGPVNSRQNEN